MTPSELPTRRRVVVTGIGLVTPGGDTIPTFWEAITQGRSFIKTISIVDPKDQPCRIAGEITDFSPDKYMDAKEAKRMDRYIQLAMAAAKQAFDDADLGKAALNMERFGVVVSSAAGGLGTIEKNMIDAIEKGYRRVSPFLVPMMIVDMAGGRIAIQYKAMGPNRAVVTACATGADSIGDAFRMIQHDEADIAFAGGSEAPITPIAMAGFAACRALSMRNDDPQRASRPFDKDRDGFVMSEGGAVLILEELEHARKRGAKIYGEVLGYGRSADAYDIVQPPADGSGAALAMKTALKDARLKPEAIDYINAHGTSTPQGDIAETNAIKAVFGDHAKNHILVSSTKSVTGHMLGATGSMEAAITLLALQNQLIPPTINLDNQDEACDLDYVPHKALAVSGFKIGLSNSFGFGGHNASLIFGRWDHS